MSRLWEKGDPLDQGVLRFTAGEDHTLDERLVRYDVVASIAHAGMLAQQGLISEAHLADIVSGLETIGASHAAGEWQISLEDEDAHTALETRLTERAPEAGARLHLGRSRNDQVLAALRLYLLDACRDLHDAAQGLATALDELAERERDTPLPGYTHLQPAMPSSVPLWAGGYAAELRDDAQGLLAARRRLDQNPLGSAAGYGVPVLPVDREHTRRELGFERTQEPVTAVQLSRGKGESQLLFEIHLLLTDLGRLAADLILFCTQEFSFVALPGHMTTGSSIMPQKRNPDVFELIRGRCATSMGCLVEALSVTTKLTSGYHRDLQLIKAPLFRGIDLAGDVLAMLATAVPDIRFIKENIHLEQSLYATEEAYRLTLDEGIPFREAYRRVGRRFRAPKE
jgi:argininosuccinate lyase